MSFLRTAVLYPLTLFLGLASLSGADRVLLMPSGGSSVVSVLDAGNLGLAGSVPATLTAFKAVGTPAGNKYFIMSRSGSDAILTVDAADLSILRRRSLENGVRDAVLTPNGEYLLVAAGPLRVIRNDLDEEVVAQVDVGGGALEIQVNSTSTRAYVLADNGQIVTVVDLESFEAIATVDVPATRSILLTQAEDRLLAVLRTGLLQIRTSDNTILGTIESQWEISSNAEISQIGTSSKVFVLNRGSAPNNTSQIFDYVSGSVKAVGVIGSTGFRDVAVIDEQRAFGVLSQERDLAEIDLTETPTAAVFPLDLDLDARTVEVSPNNRQLFLSSQSDSTVAIYDVEDDAITNVVQAPTPPASHEVIFGPSTKPPAEVTVNSGDNQFVPPGALAPGNLSVRVTDEDGVPLFNVPVEFIVRDNVEVNFHPSSLVMTNNRGIATVTVEVVDGAEAQAQALEGQTAKPLSPVKQSLTLPSASQQNEAVQAITISALASGGISADFTLNIIHETGLIKVGGDFQITDPRDEFPLPFAVLATDETGVPLPPGSIVRFAPSPAVKLCDQLLAPVDSNGFVQVNCEADELPQGIGSSRDGTITVSAEGRPELGNVEFTLTVAIGARSIQLEKVSGDDQSGETGTALSEPLVFRLVSSAPLGSKGVGIQLERIDGPSIAIDPPFVVARLNFDAAFNVVLGPRAGTAQIKATASSPNFASTTFTVEATGGVLVRFEKEGDLQSGRIGQLLPAPLRMRVFNESGQKVPFPDVTWTVIEGEATLLTGSDSDGATARVQFGLTPGPVRVQATIEGLTATFSLTATPPQPTSISVLEGQGQTVQVGNTSEPMIVEIREMDNRPAFGGFVEFRGPPTVLFHPLEEGEPANPLLVVADSLGRAGATVELLGISPNSGSGASQSSSSVTITAAAAQVFTTFTIDVLGRTPEFDAAGIVNAATFAGGLVPGSLASLFGTGLSEGVSGAEVAGGETVYKGTGVTINGVPAPLLTVSVGGETEQINLQVPFGIPAGQTTSVVVENNGSSTSISGVPIFSVQPGIFEIPLGGEETTIGAVLHASTFELVTSENPATQDEPLALFFTGGGLVDPALATGEFGPVPPAEMALPVILGVDGKGAPVSFKGYAPGLLGVYQVNFEIPEDAQCGVRPLNVTVAGTSSPQSTIAIACP